MSRLNTVDPKTATGKAQELLQTVQSKFGMVPNMTRIMANSPAVLDGYLQLSGALGKGQLSAKTREQRMSATTAWRPIRPWVGWSG